MSPICYMYTHMPYAIPITLYHSDINTTINFNISSIIRPCMCTKTDG